MLRKERQEARIDELLVVGTERATTVARADGAVRVATVEHLFAALAGLGVRDGVAIEVAGDELPLVDGGASAWVRALESLRLPRARARLVVAREAEIHALGSVYTFRRADNQVRVHFETGDPRLSCEAVWAHEVHDFAVRIAPARTFAFARDLHDLAARGLASHVSPESVVLIAEDTIHAAGAPFSADEPARHKLLDLLGDLYLYGGPPEGSVHAVRPGHAATHQVARRALECGALMVRA